MRKALPLGIVLSALVLLLVAFVPFTSAADKSAKAAGATAWDADGFRPGLAAHYYHDPGNWDGKWLDNIAKPDAKAGDWTFTNYAYTRVEPLVSHLFVRAGWFSVRWKGYLTVPPAGADGKQECTYKFLVWADDGCRLFIDGQKVIDDWRPCAENAPDSLRTATMKLAPGKHKLLVEYFQGQSLSQKDADPMKLSWQCDERKLAAEIIPESQFSCKIDDLTVTPGRLDGKDVQMKSPPAATKKSSKK